MDNEAAHVGPNITISIGKICKEVNLFCQISQESFDFSMQLTVTHVMAPPGIRRTVVLREL